MKNKNLIIGMITIVVIALLIVLISFTKGKDNFNEIDNKKDGVTSGKVSAIDNNDNYFAIIKGEKFKAGDKISGISKVGLKQESRVLNEEVSKNTYMIGAGSIYNANNKTVCNVTPFNPTNSTITVADAVIGGFEVGEYQYDKISEDILALDVEICGGIKLGASYEDVKRFFGETEKENIFTSEQLGYTTYTYKSEEVYRSYVFTIDKDGKLSKIKWQNLVYNK